MPTKNAKATASALKFFRFALVLLVVLIVGLLIIYKHNQPTLVINNHKIIVEIADTSPGREKGLGGRNSLESNHGMLFVFPKPDTACFWMKDMQFDLDILWFNSEKKLIFKKQNISHYTYPESFCPPEAASYVLEINSGQSQRLGLRLGDTFELKKQ